MATTGTHQSLGTPSAIGPIEDQAGADVIVLSGLPVEGQDLEATADASSTARVEEEQQEAREATAATLSNEEMWIRADLEMTRPTRTPEDIAPRQEKLCSIHEQRKAEEEKIDANRREFAELIEKGSEFLSPSQVRRIVQCLNGTNEEPLIMLPGLDREIGQLCRDNPRRILQQLASNQGSSPHHSPAGAQIQGIGVPKQATKRTGHVPGLQRVVATTQSVRKHS
jgi:hypothetical protein